MGKRGRARGKVEKLSAPESEYVSEQGDVLVLRGALTPKTFGDADFVVSPTATSGLAVTLSASGNCT